MSLLIEEQNEESQISKTLREQLNCPVCYETMPPPIQQCHNGHLICSDCYGHLNPLLPKTCPQCQVDMASPSRALSLEIIASQLTVPCRYSGCTEEEIVYADLSDHLKLCEHRPVKCRACGELCTNWDNLWQHFNEEHPTHCNGNDEEHACELYSVGIHLRSLMDVLSKSNSLSWIMFKCVNMVDAATGLNVRLNPFMLYRKKTDSLYFGIMEIGPPQPENSYELVLTRDVGGSMIRERRSTITKPPQQAISYRIARGEILKNEILKKCMRISTDALKEISKNFTQGLHFKIRAIVNQEETA